MEMGILQNKLEELGLDPSEVEEVVDKLGKKEKDGIGEIRKGTVEELKNQLIYEEDAIKRVQIAARIISQNLDEGYIT